MQESLGEQRLVSMRQRIATVAICLLLVLSPIKLANSVSSHVFSNFPLTGLQFFLLPWPVSWAPVFCALILILVIVANGIPSAGFLGKTWMLWIAPLVAFLACWPGWIGAQNLLQPVSFTLHMAGILAFTLALLIQLAHCPGDRRFMVMAFATGIALLCLFAAYEYFISFKMTLAQLEKVIAEHGPDSVDKQILDRLRQNRPQAGFPIPNSLGGHFVLVSPFLVALMYRLGKTVEPPHISRVVLPLLTAAALSFFIYTTKSRAAVMSLLVAIVAGAGAAAVVYRRHMKRYWPGFVALVVILPLVGFGIYRAIQDGRSLSSLDARLIYWSHGWDMFCEHPLRGIGLGEFFPNFVRMKPAGAETARLPHSMMIFFASGCGILGIAATLLFLTSPLTALIAHQRNRLNALSTPLFIGALTGLVAWLLHTQTDFNIHVPASLIAFSTCLLLSVDTSNLVAPPSSAARWSIGTALVILAVLAGTSILRTPGDYYLAKLDHMMSQRNGSTYRRTPLEDLIPIARTGTAWSPGSSQFWERIGSVALKEKRYDLAVNAYKHVVEIEPHYAAGHFKLAKALVAVDDMEAARRAFSAGLEWNPNPSSYHELREHLFGDRD